MRLLSRRSALFGASALTLLPAAAWSEDQSLKIIYPFSAGNAAEAVARLLKQWKSSETIRSWKEVAVLLRVMTNVEIYLSALESHDIPVYVVQGAAFYQKSEVSDLIAFLEAL